MRRVVVTGMGVVSPVGTGVDRFWERITEGANGIRRITRFDAADLACQVAGEVPDVSEDPYGFDVDAVMDPKEQRRTDRFIHLAMAATGEALQDAGWAPQTDSEKERTGIIIGTGVGGFPAMTAGTRLVDEKGPRRASPFLVPSFLANLAAGQISIRFGLKGPLGAPVTACAASLQAIGDAARLIRAGEADVMVTGGSEACLDRVSYAGFCAAKAMSSKRNEAPDGASRPFDQDRDGFVMGEGAGTLILEEYDHARARGATILAELTGYGTSADAYHVTASSPDGEGGLRAMKQALKSAGLAASEIGYVNAHSTSTPVGDAAEIAALTTLFEGRGKDLAVSSSKSMFGHLLGAAGAVEAVACIQALRTGHLPPSRNLTSPDEAIAGFELVPDTAIKRDVSHILTNGFGFGGVNASAVFSRI
ncbi:beta-ketoacyl-[acyl-carrier-protein] synthase II [Roseibium denhamense]|uniref:3-oxoacyl-[acyl-carrier-protein] synthase 2 n=1 Tax=Roseibium denhamense TaxID=76305 RepID=A0ABY1P829_9HYPH|nr:beta-ketoacyl-ACP synthase II [Roseibium denhamense]MTI07121.1 beta-ketoacyl-[acyl-carrier-protein] synthase II [Roseibium denhamense]SMP26972.1 3-oxoacyl-[acyl-carrier-protein] synthase II [Roseibium denhamense]